MGLLDLLNDNTFVQCFFEVEFVETSSEFSVQFTENTTEFSVQFTENTTEFEVEFGEIHTIISGGVPYVGDYIVTPKVTEQALPTAHTLLEEDVLVKSIPFYNVSNLTGGSTVYIGNEV